MNAMLQCSSLFAGLSDGLGAAKSHGVRRRNVNIKLAAMDANLHYAGVFSVMSAEPVRANGQVAADVLTN
jgi:hypothetical protein